MARVKVLGGGPAGAAASRLLASWGHRVDLVTRPVAETGLAVSLPPSCGKLFDMIDVSEAIDRAGLIRSTGNTVWWGTDSRVESFAEGARGWQVRLPALSAVMVAQAAAAGANIERALVRDESHDFTLDCTGRAGVVARGRGLREYDTTLRTVALVGEWKCHAWPLPDETHTLIESYDDGWVWSVPVAPGVRHIAAMVDPKRSDLARTGSSADVYISELRKTRAFADLISGAELVDHPRGFDASQYRASAYAGDRWLLVGDAGSFIDPLSSAGVKKALASAWMAAVAVHTADATPSMRTTAFEFFSAREHEIEQHLSRQSRAFLASAATGHPRAFWGDRADDGGPTVEEAAQVRAALDVLRSRTWWRPRLADAVSILPKPCIRGNLIVLEPHLVSAVHPGGVRYLNGIDLVVLVELLPGVSQVPDLYDGYVNRFGQASLHDFLAAIATAVARGWLVSE